VSIHERLEREHSEVTEEVWPGRQAERLNCERPRDQLLFARKGNRGWITHLPILPEPLPQNDLASSISGDERQIPRVSSSLLQELNRDDLGFMSGQHLMNKMSFWVLYR
jgi:hypothetical protein